MAITVAPATVLEDACGGADNGVCLGCLDRAVLAIGDSRSLGLGSRGRALGDGLRGGGGGSLSGGRRGSGGSR